VIKELVVGKMVVFVPLCGFAGEKIVDAGRGGRAGVLRRELIRCHSAQDPGATFHPHSFLLGDVARGSQSASPSRRRLRGSWERRGSAGSGGVSVGPG
jgi:hypothetical protein